MAKAVLRVIREMVKCPWKKRFVNRDLCEWTCRYGEKGEGGPEGTCISCYYNKKEKP